MKAVSFAPKGWSGQVEILRKMMLNKPLRQVVKKGYILRSGTPSIRSVFFVIFLCVFDLMLWLYAFWNRFYSRNKPFSSNHENPQFPPIPYGQPDRKISVFFNDSPKLQTNIMTLSQESFGTPQTEGCSRVHLSMTMFRILAAKGRPVAKCREQKVSRH